MEDKFAKIRRFLSACDELVDGKYVDAEARIAEILKAVAGSAELTNLFTAVTSEFDYPAAKRAYLRFPSEKGAAHGTAYLPAERSEILAFVFCLLVEFDGGSMQLNDFLLRYFYEDGSYTASYALFTGRMIRPFRDIVRDCYPDCGRRGDLERRAAKRDEVLGRISERLVIERTRVSKTEMGEADRASAEILLAALVAAAGRKDAAELRALLEGYRFFLRYLGSDTAETEQLIALTAGL